MAITFVNAAETNGVAGTTLVVNKPVNTASGDVMVVTISRNGGTYPSAWTPPSGWTLYADFETEAITNPRWGMYYKVAGGSEPSTYTWTFTASSVAGHIGIVAYRGVDNGTVWDVAASETINNTTAAITLAQITTVTANAWLIACLGANSSGWNWLQPTETPVWVERYDAESVQRSNAQFSVAKATAGATGTKAFTKTPSGGGTTQKVGVLAALRPGGAAGATGTAVATLRKLGAAGVGVQLFTGSAVATLKHLTAAGAGAQRQTGVAVSTLPHLTTAAAGAQTVTGTAADTLPHLTATAAGTQSYSGAVAATLPALTASATSLETVYPVATVSAGNWTAEPGGTLDGNTADTDNATYAQLLDADDPSTMVLTFDTVQQPIAGDGVLTVRARRI